MVGMKKIAVTGTHGVGKTTLAHQICVTLKEKISTPRSWRKKPARALSL
jgi:broad-specificity NMP kinase